MNQQATGRSVPGFNLPMGVSPLVPIIFAGLTTGSNDQQEQAAYAIGNPVERTDVTVIKLFVVPSNGPLIRVDSSSGAVRRKTADALGVLDRMRRH